MKRLIFLALICVILTGIFAECIKHNEHIQSSKERMNIPGYQCIPGDRGFLYVRTNAATTSLFADTFDFFERVVNINLTAEIVGEKLVVKANVYVKIGWFQVSIQVRKVVANVKKKFVLFEKGGFRGIVQVKETKICLRVECPLSINVTKCVPKSR